VSVASAVSATGAQPAVLLLAATERAPLARLLRGYGLTLALVPDGQHIPGSYWGESEAGLKGATLYARPDTPVHSVLHEASHFICMSPARRSRLDRDAGGTDLEEAAVCYLQILLAHQLPGVGGKRLMRDMDSWGYSFRCGDTRSWFEGDCADALQWLLQRRIVTGAGELTGIARSDEDEEAGPVSAAPL
jgi:hypothetical protein